MYNYVVSLKWYEMFYTMRLFYKISPHSLNARFVYAFHGFTLNRTFVVSVNLNKCCMHCIVIRCYCLMIAILICLYMGYCTKELDLLKFLLLEYWRCNLCVYGLIAFFVVFLFCFFSVPYIQYTILGYMSPTVFRKRLKTHDVVSSFIQLL